MSWLSSLTSVAGIKTLAIAIGVSSVAGGVVGARVQKKFDNAAYYQQVAKAQAERITSLEGQIKTRDAAAKADADRAANDALERKEMETKGHELETRSDDRVCFDAADTVRLRALWAGPVRPAKNRPAATPR